MSVIGFAEPMPPARSADSSIPKKVVYVPACVTRMMGPARGDTISKNVPDTMLSLFSKAGYEVVYPKVRDVQCAACIQHVDSLGNTPAAIRRGSTTFAAA